jgi:RNA polymerase sigma-70 factor (ECF subfamily)
VSARVIPLPVAPPAAERASSTPLEFRALYEAHLSFVWRSLRRLGVEDADDRAQEVFTIVYRRLPEFEDRGVGVRAWLFQIVLRVASDARRHRRRHPEDADDGAVLDRASIEPDQPAQLARKERLALLDRALARLDLDKRAVVVLHEIEEMSAPEIANALGIPLNTVYSRLRAARAALEAALEREIAASGGGER